MQEQKENNVYEKLHKGIAYLLKSDLYSLFVVGKGGMGKSFQVDKKLKESGVDYVAFSGDISDAYFHEFLYRNRDKIIVIRDVSKMLRKLEFIDILKQATELKEKRTISRLNYSPNIKVPEFEFTGKIIIELNDVGKRYKEDLDALFSRGIMVDMVLSHSDIKSVMRSICQTEVETEVTKYLIEKSKQVGRNLFNLRTQYLCFQIYNVCQKDDLEWKSEIDLFLDSQMCEVRKLLYRFSGNEPAKRIEFVKYLMRMNLWSYSTAQRRVKEWIFTDEIYTNGLDKQEVLSLHG